MQGMIGVVFGDDHELTLAITGEFDAPSLSGQIMTLHVGSEQNASRVDIHSTFNASPHVTVLRDALDTVGYDLLLTTGGRDYPYTIQGIVDGGPGKSQSGLTNNPVSDVFSPLTPPSTQEAAP